MCVCLLPELLGIPWEVAQEQCCARSLSSDRAERRGVIAPPGEAGRADSPRDAPQLVPAARAIPANVALA